MTGLKGSRHGLYQHDCDRCTYLFSRDSADHYVCTSGAYDEPCWIVRYSSVPSDYSSSDRPYSTDDVEEAEARGIRTARWYRVYLYIYCAFDHDLAILERSTLVYAIDEESAKDKAYRRNKDGFEHSQALTIGKVVGVTLPPMERSNAIDKFHRNNFAETLSVKKLHDADPWVPEDPDRHLQ